MDGITAIGLGAIGLSFLSAIPFWLIQRRADKRDEAKREANTYRRSVKCRNCGWKGRVNIATSTLVRDAVCPECLTPSLGLQYAVTIRYDKAP